MTDTSPHLDRLRRLAAAPAAQSAAAPPPEADDEYTAFGAGRVGAKPQLTVAFTSAAGCTHAFAYAHLYSVEYDPSVGIALAFTRHRITLAGRHLGDLFRYLCEHRVQGVHELDPLHADLLPPGTPIVTSLHVGLHGEGG